MKNVARDFNKTSFVSALFAFTTVPFIIRAVLIIIAY